MKIKPTNLPFTVIENKVELNSWTATSFDVLYFFSSYLAHM